MEWEIGSEFWEIPIAESMNNKYTQEQGEYIFLLSGRTALDFIIKDIKNVYDIRAVYLPSYCCHSMIQPFLDNGVQIEFYDVIFKNGRFNFNFDLEKQCDVILIMQYFGFVDDTLDQVAKEFRQRGKIVIEDATHSWFSDNPYSSYSSYVFSSFRKWVGVPCGAVAKKLHDCFNLKVPSATNTRYISLRKQAAELKKLYIEKQSQPKELFLSLFHEAEELLACDYAGYGIPEEYEKLLHVMDSEYIKLRRKANSKYLIQQLFECTGIETAVITEKDTPLFVPIIVREGYRDKLKRFLIENQIYCPVHWPLTEFHRIQDKSLYMNELSLICDQRYAETEMDRLATLIRRFFGG